MGDCTGLFESCHIFIDSEVLLKMAAKYEITGGEPPSSPSTTFADPFYTDIKDIVRDHFKGKGKGAHKMTWPRLFLCSVALVTYWVLIHRMLTQDCLWCIPAVGYLSWYFIGNVMHDASHNALVSRPWLNRLLSHSAYPFGFNISGWNIQHVMSHHIYTNDEADVDLYHFEPVLYLKKGVGTVNIMLHYLRLAYVLSSSILHLAGVVPIGLVFGQVDPAHGHAMYDRMKSIDAHRVELRTDIVLEMVAQVAFWTYYGNTQGWVKGLCFVLSTTTVSSYFFAFFTQLSHLQEECFPEKHSDASWARRQVMSSLDFAADSIVWGYISGGLNTQALHHCIPSVSAMHLRDLYPKFRQVCKKHGVQLKEASSLKSLVVGFINLSN